MKVTRPLATLRFDGSRFDPRALRIDLMLELLAYRRLVVSLAKALWRQDHPGRERLPPGFEASVILKVTGVEQDGSGEVPVLREITYPEGELPLPVDDQVDEAARLVDRAIAAAAGDGALPERFPRSLLTQFHGFGRTLGTDERILVQADRAKVAVDYTAAVRERLLLRIERTTVEAVDLVARVRGLDVDTRRFALRLDDGARIRGACEDGQQAALLRALADDVPVRIAGLAELSEVDGSLRYVVRVDRILPARASAAEAEPFALRAGG